MFAELKRRIKTVVSVCCPSLIGGDFEGDYEVLKVQHILDYEGLDWTTEVVAKVIQ